MDDLLTPADSASNVQAYSVSELAGALKRTLETTYDHVRLRGEISKVTRHSSGHVYLTLKDDKANIDGVIWKGQVRGLQTQPDTGLEVIVTGRITHLSGIFEVSDRHRADGGRRRRRAFGAA